MRMHDDEAEIDVGLVQRLLTSQFPELASLPLREVQPTGTVNALYRIGENWCARLPRVQRYAHSLERELHWLPQLSREFSLRVPQPVAKGEPDGEFPFPWAVYDWISGDQYADDLVSDEGRAAARLARFVTELRGIAITADAPSGGRAPLAQLDEQTRAAIAAGKGVIDADQALTAWERALHAPVWDGTPVWIHSDLLRPNVLVDGGALHAVIDFGGAGAGDPATDVIAAWAVFGPAGRAAYREALGVDDGTWERARGIALHQAVALIPYYAVSNPPFAALGKRTLEQVLADLSDG
jgi:aminoglycoside phosphotransferase (APT) family kinase protein